MAYKNKAIFETIRSEVPANIGANFTVLGTALTRRTVILLFSNQTNGDVLISDDGTNTKLALASNSFLIFDLRTNAPLDTDLTGAIGTQWYVKDGTTASTTGTFYFSAVTVEDVTP